MLARPLLRAFIAMVKPAPASPSRLDTGTRTSSSTTCRVGWAFQPIFRSSGPKLRPAAPAGTTIALMPSGPGPPVRAMTTWTAALPAPEMNCLVPVRTYSSPSRRAEVVSAAASDPTPGSVRQ